MNISEQESKRISILRAILALMVVNIHSINLEVHFIDGNVLWERAEWLDSIEYLFSQIISRMAVPAFYMLSSILLYRKPFSFEGNIIKKVKTLIIPYLICNTIWIIIFVILQAIPSFESYFTMDNSIIANWGLLDWLHAYGIGSVPLVSPLWFLRDLFVLNILSVVIYKIVSWYPSAILFITLCFWILPYNTNIGFLDKQALCFWIFGCYFVIKDIGLSKVDNINKQALAVVYLILIIIDLFTRYELYNSYFHNFSILVAIPFWYVITNRLLRMKVCRFFDIISTYSFAIYLYHELTLNCINKVYAKMVPSLPIFQLIGYIIVPLTVIFMCVAVSSIIKRKYPQLYSVAIGK